MIHKINFKNGLLAAAVCLAAALCLTEAANAAKGEKMAEIEISKQGAQPVLEGDANHFTGKVIISGAFKGSPPAQIGGATVAFAPSARTAWHTHPLGQILLIVSGRGLVQKWGGSIESVSAGDIVRIPPNVKHWHGAAPDSPMIHIAITEAVDGKSADWLEKVSEAQYSAQQISRGKAND